LLRCLRERCNWDVLVFTGHPIEKIAPTLAQLSGLVDALISDSFEIHTAQTKALRGSDNQRLHLLTPRGVQRFAAYERLRLEQDRRLDVMFDQDGSAWLAGIPARGDLQRLLELLALEGARASTTAAPATSPPRQPT
jgi:anaerobic ribonucleoside-triphosphate reductase activating protein